MGKGLNSVEMELVIECYGLAIEIIDEKEKGKFIPDCKSKKSHYKQKFMQQYHSLIYFMNHI